VDWQTFLTVMIEDERAAIKKYRVALEKADSEPLCTVLERLMHEEEFHVDLLLLRLLLQGSGDEGVAHQSTVKCVYDILTVFADSRDVAANGAESLGPGACAKCT
jgi:rubrerythrin